MTGRLRGLGLEGRYRTGRNDVVRDFYVPAMSVSDEYCRAVGYFTAASLGLLSRGIDTFLGGGGTIKIVASPKLEADDIADIERGYELRDVLERSALRALENDLDEALLDGLSTVGRLVAEGRLDIKLAFLSEGGRIGMYHEKIGYFRDPSGDVVAFTGSSNETYSGMMLNFESVEVYRSWLPGDDHRALELVDEFNDLWNNRTKSLQIMDFPEAARRRLLQIAADHEVGPIPGFDDALSIKGVEAVRSGVLRTPSAFVPRAYQSEAIRAWLANKGRGILKMATGTGKTKTALAAAVQVAQAHARRAQPVLVVIVAPLTHLVDQWSDEVRAFGVNPVPIYESSKKWIPAAEDALDALRLGRGQCAVFVATNASFGSETFQAMLERVAMPLMLIGDEVHNLGARSMRVRLPHSATYRLGLSATPERFMDDEGTQGLIDYFGPIVFTMGLSDAIDAGALCRYHYHPRLVELDDSEMALYAELTAQIAPLLASVESIDDADGDSPLGMLLRKRSGVLGHAAGKLSVLRPDVTRHAEDWFQLVYCAEGRRPSDDPSGPLGPRQIDDVMQLVGRQLRLTAHSYVSDTPRAERKALLRQFESARVLRVLVAMRCLDEGVDIPDARVAYLLASSANPRQFIQRRGRLLRPAPGKSHADIYDYLAVPQGDFVASHWEIERQLVRRELERAVEFAGLSDNYAETLRILRPLRERYQLMDL